MWFEPCSKRLTVDPLDTLIHSDLCSSSKIEYLLITWACFQPKKTFWHKAFLVVWQWIEVSYVQIPCREFMISTNASSSSSSWRCHVICVWQRRSWIKIPFPPLFTCDLSKSHISWIVFKLESPLNTISIAVVNHLIRPRKSNFVSL